jgi:N-acetyl-anhydromuramyl-L-alanine amidase AmpD
VLRSPGRPLDAATRSFFEPRFGRDFGNVRLHEGASAAKAAAAVSASAFTAGADIVFRDRGGGHGLLAHELAHVVQNTSQNNGPFAVIRRQPVSHTPGHEAGGDYSAGVVTAKGKTFLLQADHKTKMLDSAKKNALYFETGDVVTNLHASADDMWVKVRGMAHAGAGKSRTDVAGTQGWIERRSTDMTLGLFKGLHIRDNTSKSGAGRISQGVAKGHVTSIILHQTDSDTEENTLSSYAGSATAGAEYLIGETGQSHLVVPINEKAAHVATSNRPVRVTPPKVADPKAVTTEEMKKTTEQISAFYANPDVRNFISKTQRDFWMALARESSQKFYEALKAAKWQVNVAASNMTSVGIEVVHRHSTVSHGGLDSSTFKPAAKDPELQKKNAPTNRQKIDAFVGNVGALNLSPDLKAQLLRSKERNAISLELLDPATTSKRRDELDAQLLALDKSLYTFMAANYFIVYEDITGQQKRSLWALVSKLTEHYGLDPKRDVVGHEDVSQKHFGEGQSEAEFIRAMADFVANVKTIGGLAKIMPEKETRDKIAQTWAYELHIVAAVESGKDTPEVRDFFDHFYDKAAAFDKSGSLALIKLWKAAQKLRGP